MARSSKALEATLSQLKELRADPTAPASLERLTKALSDRSNLVAARAAEIVREARLDALLPHVAGMFRRFMADPVKSDPGCAAKRAAAQALYELGADERDLLLDGARFVQHEPSFGRAFDKPLDTAAELRATCALALVRLGHPQQLEVLADHLVDPEPQVRLTAARGIGYSGSDAGALLLRLKVQAGDAEEDVLAECFAQLVRLSPARSIAFTTRFLDVPDESLRRAAAFALGGSREPAALRALTDRWEADFTPENRHFLVPAIAMHRSKEAIDFLIDRLDAVGPELGAAVIEGLSAHRQDPSVRRRVSQITVARDDPVVREAWARHFER
jgi:HEAT repeat protein